MCPVVESVVTPAGPYSLALSARHASDATRRFRDGRLDAVVLPRPAGPTSGLAATAAAVPERASAWQRPDGAVVLRAATEGGLAAMRFQLALDDDHSPFLERFADDALLGPALRELRGLRQLRVGSVAQALLRALCGQLILASTARAIERAVIRAVAPASAGPPGTAGRDRLHAPPTSAQLASLSPARLRALGLHARRGATLVRVCSGLDLERLHDASTYAVAARLERERGLGPWSVGVVCLEGLGRTERGLVGDLGLVVLAGQLLGRRTEAHETAALLEPYGEWAGLASVYLLAGAGRGLVPVPAATGAGGNAAA
jgi:DNA-3-methyladenine glycosylase II